MTGTTPPALDRTHALFLDFDGTLTAIEDDPRAVRLSAETLDLLERIGERLGGAVAMLSGRDLRDLDARTPRSLMRIGEHGLEIAPPGESPAPDRAASPPELLAALKKIAGAYDGVWLEPKGLVMAMHYREAPEHAGDIYEKVKEAIASAPSYVAQVGKMVIEAKPANANKGRALLAAMEAPPFAGRRPVTVGDDTTDEDAFGAVAELGGFGVKVGPGDTAAAFRLADHGAVIDWLRRSLG